MSNNFTIIAEDVDDLLDAGAYGAGAIIRVQTSATEGGAYADLTGTGSTPTLALVAGTRAYTAFDPAGLSTSWYRTRYENVGATRVSDWSAPFQLGSIPALCTVGQVKARLFPAGPVDTADDVLIEELIAQVTDWIEGYTHRTLHPIPSRTYTFDTRTGYTLQIPIGVRTVTLLEVAQTHQPDAGGTYMTVAATDYLLRPHQQDSDVETWPYTEIRIARAAVGSVRSFVTAENGARVTGTFGFAATPPAIVAVAIDATVVAYQQRKSGASGVIGAEDMAIVPWRNYFAKGSPQRATLDRYRVWVV